VRLSPVCCTAGWRGPAGRVSIGERRGARRDEVRGNGPIRFIYFISATSVMSATNLPPLRTLLKSHAVHSPLGLSTMLARTMSTFIATRPQFWKATAPALPGTTFAAQPDLPKLPIPDLPATLTRLKEALKPLATSNAEYAVAVTKIDQFGQGTGKVLHNRLLERDAERKHWLEGWWDDIAYLGYRDSVCTSHTPCHPLLSGDRSSLMSPTTVRALPTSYSTHSPRSRRLRPPTRPPTPNYRRTSCCSSPRSHDLPPTAKARSDQTRRHQRRSPLHGHIQVR